MQALARWGDPLGVWVGGEESRLLGIGAEAADDDQGDPVGAGGGRQAVEGQRYVWPHRLSTAVSERTGVAATAGHGRHPSRAEHRQLSRRARLDGHVLTPPAVVDPHADGATGADSDTRRREAAAGKGHVGDPKPNAVSRCCASGGGTSASQVLKCRQVTRVRQAVRQRRRLEEAEVVLAHPVRGRDRRQVGGTLVARLAAECLAETDQHEHADERHRDDAEHRQ
jgi:hypothetical protein